MADTEPTLPIITIYRNEINLIIKNKEYQTDYKISYSRTCYLWDKRNMLDTIKCLKVND